jgi:elongation factor Ts
MAISAAQVKELRERTGAGMMECKKALVETDGDIDAAIEQMRKSGLAKADKKSGRVAAEGLVSINISGDGKNAAVVEVNCETDFVAGGDDFKDFVAAVADRVLNDKPADLDALLAMPLKDGADASINEARQAMVAKIGENIQVRRFELFETDGFFGSYLHGSRIGVLVDMNGGDATLAKDIAMHIAASRPVCVAEKDVPEEMLAKEKEILIAQAKESGKPDNIIEKMIEGRIRKYLAEITLLGQAFVKDPDITVGKLLDKSSASVNRFIRMEVGEGIEKKTENFADEVMAQIKG